VAPAEGAAAGEARAAGSSEGKAAAKGKKDKAAKDSPLEELDNVVEVASEDDSESRTSPDGRAPEEPPEDDDGWPVWAWILIGLGGVLVFFFVVELLSE
jgi:hypothetical protein